MRLTWSPPGLSPNTAHPLHRRLTLMMVLVVAATLVATGVAGWLTLRSTMWSNSAQESLATGHALAPLARQDLAVDGRLSSRVLGTGSTVVEAVAADGSVLLAPGENTVLDIGAGEVQAARAQQVTARNLEGPEGAIYRLVTVPLGDERVLVVARPLVVSPQVLHVFGLVVLAVAVAGLALAWLLARGVSKAALVPLSRFTDAVRHVADTEDLRPVSAAYGRGLLASLATAFNLMLTRLALSRAQQNRLVADASHELRTPLTSIRTNLELLALDTRHRRLPEAAREQVVDEALTKTVELTSLIDDLMHLTRDHHTAASRAPVDLCGVVETALRQVSRRRQDVTFDVELDPAAVLGDAGSLTRAVAAILDNAVKWSPSGGTVYVRLHDHELRIVDEGPGHRRRRPSPRHRPLFPGRRRSKHLRRRSRVVHRRPSRPRPRRHHQHRALTDGGTQVSIDLTNAPPDRPPTPPRQPPSPPGWPTSTADPAGKAGPHLSVVPGEPTAA